MNSEQISLQQRVSGQREELGELLAPPLRELAKACVPVWGNRDGLNYTLQNGFSSIPYAKYLYVLNPEGVQISDNITHGELVGVDYGRDRSDRPYMQGMSPGRDFVLSQAYISLRARRPGLTALQVVHQENGALLGYLGCDVDLRDLPRSSSGYTEPTEWRQVRGDPSIRRGVFMQSRAESELDRNMDVVMGVMEELILDHGVFHSKIHFSSSRATIWLFNDPYRYRLLYIDSLTDPDICLAYPRLSYPEDAMIPSDKIRAILDGFRELRYMDETLYLRAATMNIFNGMINLTFSCDGSHYMQWDEFLDREHAFWSSAGDSA